MEVFSAVVAWLLFWLPRAAVVLVVLTGATWVTAKGVGWFAPQQGDPAPEFQVVGGSADQGVLLARLLQAKFMQIKVDLVSGTGTVDRLLQAWTTEFEERNRKKQSQTVRLGQSVGQSSTQIETKVIASETRAPVDLAKVSAVIDKLAILSSDINRANVPDIKIASVELGPVLHWVIDLLRPPSDNKVVIFE